MITIEQIKEGIREQSQQAADLIARMKDEGDLKYFETIESMQLIINMNDLIIKKLDWEGATQEELQSYHNTLLSFKESFQGLN